MAKFSNIQLTQRGLDMMVNADNTKKVIYTKIGLGDGILTESEDIKTLNALKHEIIKSNISHIQNDSASQITLETVISNNSIENAFYARELGVFAKLGEDGEEILYAYANAKDTCDYIPDKSQPVDELKLKITLVVGNVENVTVEINPSIVFTTLEDCHREIQEHNISNAAHDNLARKDDVYTKIETDNKLKEKADKNHGLHVPQTQTPSNSVFLRNDNTWQQVTPDNIGAPMKNGTGATGTWDINISGTAAKLQNWSLQQILDNFLNMWHSSKAYKLGDIAFHKNLPTWARLECVVTGTTDAAISISNEIKAGQYIVDGSCKWIIDDVRDNSVVGSIRGSLYLPDGYVLADGRTVNRADYPRLVTLADKYSLWTDDVNANLGMFGKGDNNSTFVLPNWIDRMAQFAAQGGATIAAGLPNITGVIRAIGESFATNGYAGEKSALYKESSGPYVHDTQSNTDGGSAGSIGFDASRSNVIYGASNTVQPPTITMIPILKY